MAILRMQGARELRGILQVQRAKNAVLPMLAGALLAGGETVLADCPRLSDVENMLKILRSLGCECLWRGKDIHIRADAATRWEIPEDLSGLLRSSIFLLGPIVARFGRAAVAYPGGCEIGLRPIDLHLKGLRALGVEIREEFGRIICETKGLSGAEIMLDFPSVGATENILMAACLAKGVTRIHNAAMEPEIADLAAFLNRLGAKIRGAGTGQIEITGVDSLCGAKYTPMPDRIAAGTYLCAAAACGGEIRLENARPGDLRAVIGKLREAGCEIGEEEGAISLERRGKLRAVAVSTMPHPGFPTDMQSQFLAMACVSRGVSMIVENLFENRFGAAAQLRRMGADISVNRSTAVVRGGTLSGARVLAGDLRAGAALAVAGLAAQGYTEIAGVDKIDRGYENLEGDLSALGAKIWRVI